MARILKETFLQSVGGRRLTCGGEEVWDFGWRGPGNLVRPLDHDQQQLHAEQVKAVLTPFELQGAFDIPNGRVKLWEAPKTVLGRFLPYIWQTVGSCVGAGGSNMARTRMCVEVAQGELEQYQEIFWPITWGWSRELSGIRGRGDGSTGIGWSEAAQKRGFIAADQPGLPQMREKEGWLQLSGNEELDYSDGARIDQKWRKLGVEHLFTKVAQMRSAEDVAASIVALCPCTQASNFGMRSMVPRAQSDPPVRLGSWDGSWSHQTYFDEVWDHPKLGMIFRWGNNWGPGAHGAPTGDEPPGGVYLKADTVDRICRTGEVFSFAGLNGWVARKIKWSDLA